MQLHCDAFMLTYFCAIGFLFFHLIHAELSSACMCVHSLQVAEWERLIGKMTWAELQALRAHVNYKLELVL